MATLQRALFSDESTSQCPLVEVASLSLTAFDVHDMNTVVLGDLLVYAAIEFDAFLVLSWLLECGYPSASAQ